MFTQNGHRAKLLTLWIVVLAITTFACQVVSPNETFGSPASPPEQAVQVTVSAPIQAAPTPTPNPDVHEEIQNIAGEDTVLIDLYARVNPSVVNITNFGEVNSQVEPLGQGSGFVFDNQGNIVTNAHVVHGASGVEVTFSEGTTRPAEIIGEDLNADLAVVRVDILPEGVVPLSLGDMEGLAVGQTVVAIGNPFGLAGTLTRGIISALGRSIPALTPFSIPQSIQTDAAINPGNSGGPLLNLQGEVIGVNAQIETGGTTRSNLGIGFAIPVSIVRRIVPDLIEKGEHQWAWLGVQGGDLTPTLVEAMNLPLEKGAYIADVVQDGPSAKAGLRGSTDQATVRNRQVDVGGDIVVAVDGQPVNSFDDLLVYVALNVSPEQTVTLKVYRDGEYRDVQVNLEPRPDDMQSPLQLP